MKNLNEMNKAELRAACKEAGVKNYGNMTTQQMREAVAATQAPVKRDVAMGTGIKIEKNREERNGIKRPSIGGVCSKIWAFCDAYLAECGRAPKLSVMKQRAELEKWDSVTTVVQYYQWRKFQGIQGRV
jgi:hypothetical protein